MHDKGGVRLLGIIFFDYQVFKCPTIPHESGNAGEMSQRLTDIKDVKKLLWVLSIRLKIIIFEWMKKPASIQIRDFFPVRTLIESMEGADRNRLILTY